MLYHTLASVIVSSSGVNHITQSLYLIQHIKKGELQVKSILSFMKAFSQPQNDTSLIKIDQGIPILQLKNYHKFFLFPYYFVNVFNLYSLPKVPPFDVLAHTHNDLQIILKSLPTCKLDCK